jgi:hypothetical protein
MPRDSDEEPVESVAGACTSRARGEEGEALGSMPRPLGAACTNFCFGLYTVCCTHGMGVGRAGEQRVAGVKNGGDMLIGRSLKLVIASYAHRGTHLASRLLSSASMLTTTADMPVHTDMEIQDMRQRYVNTINYLIGWPSLDGRVRHQVTGAVWV